MSLKCYKGWQVIGWMNNWKNHFFMCCVPTGCKWSWTSTTSCTFYLIINFVFCCFSWTLFHHPFAEVHQVYYELFSSYQAVLTVITILNFDTRLETNILFKNIIRLKITRMKRILLNVIYKRSIFAIGIHEKWKFIIETVKMFAIVLKW